MKLAAGKIVAGDESGNRTAVVGSQHYVRGLARGEVIRVHEIAVEAVRPKSQIIEQRMWPQAIERVPAHVRNLEVRVPWLDPHDIAGDPPKAFGLAVLEAAGRHQLHANTDAIERLAALD